MAISIGRLGYLGLGIESTQGDAVAPSVYLPYTENSMRGHHEPIEVIGAKTSRITQKGSVVGKKWGEGDVAIDLDVVNAGYLFKLALGNELLATGTPNTHTFYTSVSGNTPKTATLVNSRETDVEQYVSAAIDELTMEVSDSLATLSASFMTNFPTTTASVTATTTSGTVLAFKDYSLKFGSNLTTAAAASATPANELSLTIANNLEVIHRSGSADVSTIRNKGLSVTGSYTLFFDSTTDRDAYYALNKRAMKIQFTGNADESITINIPRFRLSEGEISTGIDDFYVINCEFVAEDVVDSTGTRFIDVVMENDKSTVY